MHRSRENTDGKILNRITITLNRYNNVNKAQIKKNNDLKVTYLYCLK